MNKEEQKALETLRMAEMNRLRGITKKIVSILDEENCTILPEILLIGSRQEFGWRVVPRPQRNEPNILRTNG